MKDDLRAIGTVNTVIDVSQALLEITKLNTVPPMFKTAEDADRNFTGTAAKA